MEENTKELDEKELDEKELDEVSGGIDCTPDYGNQKLLYN